MQRRGRAVRAKHVVMVMAENEHRERRLGVTVSSRVGKAVARSQVKRWFRHIFRKNRARLPSGVDVVLIARPGSLEAGFATIEREVLGLFEQAGRWSTTSREET